MAAQNRYKPISTHLLSQLSLTVQAFFSTKLGFLLVLFGVFLILLNTIVFSNLSESTAEIYAKEVQLRRERVDYESIHGHDRPASVNVIMDDSLWKDRIDLLENFKKKHWKQKETEEKARACPYKNLNDLTEEQKQPVANERHMISPPKGGKITLVCCDTTKGSLAILAHDKWAPKGTQRFLDMVKSGYFNSGVPMMRCVKSFLCQFGLNSSKEKRRDFVKAIEDDPNWLPEGLTYRQNDLGVKRFAQGYLAYAGNGKNSRSNQLIVALESNGPLAGGSPWEVPWGELVGEHSFETLSEIYTGYGENGPKQGMLQNNGMTEDMKLVFPKLDYINRCEVIDEYDYGNG